MHTYIVTLDIGGATLALLTSLLRTMTEVTYLLMSKPNIAVYAGNSLGGSGIVTNLPATTQAGWTTIILGLFHIGYPPGQLEAEIFFNDVPVVADGKYLGDPSWPNNIAQLKQNSSITQIYASFGGGSPVQDFTTILKIYHGNNHRFDGTLLKKNLEVFRETFSAIDGIDMDCEDYYDTADSPNNSFAGFCAMLISMGFDITFCPYMRSSWWVDMLKRLSEHHSGHVKWWNLQCYAGGDNNIPEDWADDITKAGFSADQFILTRDWNRFWDPNYNVWSGRCPEEVKERISPYKQQSWFGGGFIWQMDAILNPGGNWSTSGCASKEQPGMGDYIKAIQ